MGCLRCSLMLVTVNSKVVTTFETGINAKLLQHFQDRFGVFAKIVQGVVLVGLYKCEVEVPQIVKHGTSAGEPAYHPNVIFLHVIEVNFRQGILMFANNNGRLITPEHKDIFFGFFQEILFGGKVKIGIGMISFNDKHKCDFESKLQFPGKYVRDKCNSCK